MNSDENAKRKADLEARRAKLEAIKEKRRQLEEQKKHHETPDKNRERDLIDKAKEYMNEDSVHSPSPLKNSSHKFDTETTRFDNEIPLIVESFKGCSVRPIYKSKGIEKEVQCDLDLEESDDENNQEVDMANETNRSPEKVEKTHIEKQKSHYKGIEETLYEKYKAEMKAVHGKEYNHHEVSELYQNNDEFVYFLTSKTKLIEKVVFGEKSIFDQIDAEDTPDQTINKSISAENSPYLSTKNKYKRSNSKDPGASIRKPKIKHLLDLKDEEGYSNSKDIVSDMIWSYNIPYMLAASYSKSDPKEDFYEDYPGKVQLWNTNFSLRPEFTCQAKSRVTKIAFDQFQSNVIYGGLGSGHISVWDVRAQRKPVTNVNPSPDTHCGPIYGQNFVGSRNSSIQISISNDGRLCTWTPNKLCAPIKSIPLTFQMPNEKSKEDSAFPISPLCMTVPYGSTNVVYIGTMDKQIRQQNLHTSDEDKQARIFQEFQGHEGPVCSLSYATNLLKSNCPTNGFMLSSSFDWGIRMWNPKITQESIFNFEWHKDYVVDVQWNPIHPGMFISTDVDGKTGIWNMYVDREKPVAVDENKSSSNSKCKWNINGTHFAIGDMDGNIQIKKLSKSDVYNDDQQEHLVEFVDLVNQLSNEHEQRADEYKY